MASESFTSNRIMKKWIEYTLIPQRERKITLDFNIDEEEEIPMRDMAPSGWRNVMYLVPIEVCDDWDDRELLEDEIVSAINQQYYRGNPTDRVYLVFDRIAYGEKPCMCGQENCRGKNRLTAEVWMPESLV